VSSLELELRLYRFLAGLDARLKEARNPEGVLRSALRDTAEFFQAEAACLAALPPGGEQARVSFGIPAGRDWDLDLLTGFYRHERPAIPDNILLAPLYRRGRRWLVLAILRDDRTFEPGRHKLLSKIAHTISDRIEQIDRERIIEVRSRIERKIMEELRPKDVFYQILHGLRSLTGYDHSSALFIAGEQGDALQLVAEQIAWRKAKSDRIGLRLPISSEMQALMGAGGVVGFDRQGDDWRAWAGEEPTDLARLLDYNATAREDESALREASMLCAPLVTKDGVMGVLKVASRFRGSLGPYEAELVEGFLPQVSVAIRNSRRTESLQAKMLDAEKKSAMANLARSVAHDVNNALGSILPLVQQLHEDSRANEIEHEILTDDLGEIERSLQVCRRIFGGMLNFAREAARGGGCGDIRLAVDDAMAILDDGLKRRGIRVEMTIPADLPPVRGSQAELEQVFFNLMANARDAMPEGGTLTLRARQLRDGQIEAVVEDTGSGISETDFPHILEPFYTTKTQGYGLGLAICRSIIWEMRGKFDIKSGEEEGTRVTLVLPTDGRAAAEEDA